MTINGDGTTWQLPVLGDYYAKLTPRSARSGGPARIQVENDTLTCDVGQTVTARDGWRV